MISYTSSIYAYDDNCRLCISIVLSFCLYSQLLSDQYRTDYKSLSSADTRAWSGPAVLVIVSSDDPSVHLFTCHIAYHHRLLPTTAFYSVNNNIWINSIEDTKNFLEFSVYWAVKLRIHLFLNWILTLNDRNIEKFSSLWLTKHVFGILGTYRVWNLEYSIDETWIFRSI